MLTPSAVLAPRDCAVSVVVFVPLLREDRPADSPPVRTERQEPALDDATHAQDGPTPGLQPFRGLLDHLRLWGYSEHVNETLREFLPHRLSSDDLAPGLLPALPLGRGRWEPVGGTVETWTAEVGMVALIYRLVDCGQVTWAEIRDSVMGTSEKSGLLSATERLFAEGCPAAAGAPWTSLWVQAYFVVQADRGSDGAALDTVACELSERGDCLQPRGDWPQDAVRLGTAACTVSTATEPELADAVGRVLATQSAAWAAAIDMDRNLGGLLSRGGQEARRCSLDALEARSTELLVEFEQVQQFRAGVEMLPLHLGAPDRAVWEWVSTVWGLGQQLMAMDTKLTAIEHVYGHLTTAMSARQARFLNRVVLGVTCLSLATFVLTVWDFTQKSFDPFQWLSALVTLVAAALAWIFFGWAWRTSTRREQPLDRIRGPGQAGG
ncbi:hypothetical protein [Geodermatophilus sp. URMC 64]